MQLKQISVFLENKSRRLSRVTQILKEADIDILALCVADSNEYGILRMIVDKPAKAMEELEKAKFTVSLTKVIGVAIPDNAGGLSTVIELLAKQHISMEYIYAFTSRKIGEAIIILRVEDTSAAIDVLTNHDFKLLTHKEVLKE